MPNTPRVTLISYAARAEDNRLAQMSSLPSMLGLRGTLCTWLNVGPMFPFMFSNSFAHLMICDPMQFAYRVLLAGFKAQSHKTYTVIQLRIDRYLSLDPGYRNKGVISIYGWIFISFWQFAQIYVYAIIIIL